MGYETLIRRAHVMTRKNTLKSLPTDTEFRVVGLDLAKSLDLRGWSRDQSGEDVKFYKLLEHRPFYVFRHSRLLQILYFSIHLSG